MVFCLFLIIFVWREYDKNKRSFDVEKGYEDVGGVGGEANFVCVLGGFQK